MRKLLRMSVLHPYWVIAIVSIITLLFAVQIPKLKIDNRIEIYLSDDNPVVKAWWDNHDEFGEHLDVLVGVLSEDIFTPNTLNKISGIAKEIEKIPKVREVTTILNASHIEGSESGIDVAPMVEEGSVPQSPEDIKVFKEKVSSWDLYKGILITEDGRGSLLSIVFEEGIETDDIIPIYHRIDGIVKKYEGPEQVFIAGVPAVEALQADYMNKDLKVFIPLVYIIIIVTMFMFFWNVRGVVLPVLNVSIATTWSLGLMSLLKIPVSTSTNTVPVILLGVGTAYAIHVLENIFSDAARGKGGRQGIINALNRVSPPVIMAGLTTAAGFLSLFTSEVIPVRDFGLIAAFGILVACITSLTLVPAILTILEDKGKAYIPHHHTKKDIVAPLLKWFAYLSLRKSVPIIVLSIIIVIVSGVYSLTIKSDLNAVEHFREDSPIRTADTILNEKFGGTSVFNVVIKGQSPDTIKDPQVLHHVEALQTNLASIKGVGKTMSIVDLIKKMNQEMHDGDPSYYTIPDSQDLIAQYLLLYSFSGGEDLSRLVNYDYQDAQILLQMKTTSGFLAKDVLSVINNYEKNELRNTGLTISTTGVSAMAQEFNRIIFKGQKTSFVACLILVILITSLIFRSAKLGFFSTLPLVVSIMLNFGIMGAFGITLNAATAMIASLTVGMGIDYSIHFLSRYRHELAIVDDMRRAIVVSTYTAGRAIIYNSLAVTAGFLVLVPSNFVIISQMGLLTAILMLTSAIVAITLLPAMLKVFHPEIKAEQGDTENNKENGGV